MLVFTEQIRYLIRDKQNEVVKMILEDCHYNYTDITKKASLLHYAAQCGNVEMTKYLLDKGCPVDCRSPGISAYTPLMLALEERYPKIVRILLAAGANVYRKNGFNQDALLLCLDLCPKPSFLLPIFDALKKKYSSKQIAKTLIDYKCHLAHAVHSRDAKIIEYMIRSGVPINGQRACPLHIAVLLNHVQTVKVLLKYGVDIEARSRSGLTAIHYLCVRKSGRNRDRLEILKLLLSRGVSLTSISSSGYFQINLTLARGTSKIVRAILQSKPDCTVRDHFSGATIFHVIMFNRNIGVVDELKRYIDKFDINARDHFGRKPLFLAVLEGNISMVKFLLDHGAEPDADAFLYAYYTRPRSDLYPGMEIFRNECVEFLLQRNVDPQLVFNTESTQGKTFVEEAIENKQFCRIKLTLARLAMYKEQEVHQSTRLTIQSHSRLKTYFEKCQRLLTKKISGNVSVFKLMTADDRKFVKYLNNEKLVRKLVRLGHKRQLNTIYRYFYSTIKKRFSKGILNKTLRDKAAGFICDISGDRLDRRHLATEMVIDFLNDQDLRRVYAI